MEFLGGVLTAFAAVYLGYKMFVKELRKPIPVPLFSQSSKMSTNRFYYYDYLGDNNKPLKTQATDFFDRYSTRFVIQNNTAYWIQNNALYTAPIAQDGNINTESKQRVDTMTMDDVELKQIMIIIDKLNEGL